ncbi:MAG: hypothetical protein DMF89_07750 [Acidobacteria bacterium]|nr:MAG: hypothetical protein DMF89_07750 [Acidobacteriota bacterium]
MRDFRVRLACVRHAASVDSEPGSNSHVKSVLRLRRPSHPRTLGYGFGARNLLNARPIGSALFSPLLLSWFAASCRSRTEEPVSRPRGATR